MNDKNKTPRLSQIIISALLICSIVLLCISCSGAIQEDHENQDNDAAVSSETEESEIEETADDQSVAGTLSHEGYKLEQVVILSRHNIRSPLSGGDSLLGKITPHTWFEWSSNPSELSLRGGVLETEMGQYFRKWLESEGLFPENYHPKKGEVRIYANSKQRTIATSRYFTSGLLPTAKTSVETHMKFDEMDPVFTPQLTFVSPEYNEDAEEQIWDLYADDVKELADNYELLEDVIDLEDSEAYKDGEVTGFKTDDSKIILELNKEPAVEGSLKTGCSVSDALVLQYYEESDPVKAAFGHELSFKQWQQISEIKDRYVDVLYTSPLISTNIAHPLLKEIRSELKTEGRTFSFLCGHDSNVGSVLAALGAEDYELPGAIEAKTPIGCKLVFCRWIGPDGGKYVSVDLVYENTEQLRNTPILDLTVHPAAVPVSFSGLSANADDMYTEKDFMKLLRKSIKAYDDMTEDYSLEEAA
ncbi:MAG: histidine-type phosphatase [Eubacterium sp.]|nr:histidine-type phosphatase [Eubacterium sp.]